MIKNYIACIFLFFSFACSNIEFILKYDEDENPLKNKTVLIIDKNMDDRYAKNLYSYFGSSKENDYILKIKFTEKKENRIVKNNQVAEKVEYTLIVDYDLFYKTSKCKIFEKTIVTKFSFTPKSAGYNFGSDMSFDKLYNTSVEKKLNNFYGVLKINKSCIE